MTPESTDQPLVSIVLPTYTRAQLLPHAIRSVLAQTHRNLELIVVDDNSKDNTPEIVRGFDDPRIRYVRNEENLKLPRGLNKGFGLARGDFLTWTSDDNLYAPEAIARMVGVLRGGDCGFVYADYYDFARLDETGRPVEPKRVQLPDVLKLEERNTVGACFMYTRAVQEAVGPYDQELFLVEDYDYFIRIAQRFRTCHIPEALYYFSRHDDSLYVSRYAEVKAADILVRFKNGLIDRDSAAAACVRLVMQRPGELRNPLLRTLHGLLGRTSYRLGSAYERRLREHLRRALGPQVGTVLEQFSARALDFRAAKDRLQAILLGVSRLQYK